MGKPDSDHRESANQQGEQLEDLEVTVDTGSTFTAVPRAHAGDGSECRSDRTAQVPHGRRADRSSGHRLDNGPARGSYHCHAGDLR